MPNERLRDALVRNGFTPESLARRVKVDPKTVERWITKGRAPYPRHRNAIAALVRETESYLWPDAVSPERKAEIGESEVVKIYPHRYDVPVNIWARLIEEAGEHIEMLMYSGMFLTDNPALIKKLRVKAKAGVKVRVIVGDPTSRAVARRSDEEGIGKGVLASKARNVLAFFRPLADVNGITIRTHSTTLYNSIYRFDDDMLVNTHVYGFMAAHSPLLHLRQLSGGDLFETYSASFDNVWNTAKPPRW